MAGLEIVTTTPDIAWEIANMGGYLKEVLTPGFTPEHLGEEAWRKFVENVEDTRGKESTGRFEYYRKAQAIYETLFSYAERYKSATSDEGYSELEQKAIARGVRKVGKELRDLFESGLAEHAFRIEPPYQFSDMELNKDEIVGKWNEFLALTFPRSNAVR